MVQVIHRAYARTPGVDVVRNDAVLAEFVATRHWKHTAPLQHRAHISNIIGTISKPSTRRWFRLSIGLMRERLALTWFATKLFSPKFVATRHGARTTPEPHRNSSAFQTEHERSGMGMRKLLSRSARSDQKSVTAR